MFDLIEFKVPLKIFLHRTSSGTTETGATLYFSCGTLQRTHLCWKYEGFQLQLTGLVLVERTCRKNEVPPQHTISRISLLKHRYFGSFTSDYVPNAPTENFANINTQLAICRVSIGY